MKRVVATLVALVMIIAMVPTVFAATESGNWMIAAGATQEWTATASGTVALSSESGNSIAALDAEGNYLGMGINPSFEAVEGETYTIQHFGTGYDVIYWELTAATEGEDGGSTEATSGTLEIEAYGNVDWTAPQDGTVKFTINISGATLTIVNGYTPVAEGTDSVTAKVTAGTTYLVAPGFDVTENSVVTWEYVADEDTGDDGEGSGDAGESIPSGSALALGNSNVTLTYASMAAQAPYWTYTATEGGYLTVTVSSINGDSNLGMAFGRGMYTLLVGEATGEYTNTASVYMNADETVNIAVLDTLDTVEVPAVLNLAFEAGEEVVEKNPADYFDTDENGYYVIGSLEAPVDIFVGGSDDIYYTYTAEADGAVYLTATVDGYSATNCAIKVNDGSYAYSATYANVAAGDVVTINIWSGYEGTVSLGETVVEEEEPTEKNPADYFDTDDNGYYIIGSLESSVDIFVGEDDIYYTYTAESTDTVYLTATVDGNTNCLFQVNGGEWSSETSVAVEAGDVLLINIWSGYEGTVSLGAPAEEEPVEKNPADYFETDENGNYIIGSLESPVDIFVGEDDIYYTYTAESTDTVYLTATVDGYAATNCLFQVNGGDWTSGTSVAVEAGDVVLINIWSGFEGTLSLGAPVDNGGDDSGDAEDTNALVLGDNEVTLTYATMPAMAPTWTYTATENGYLTVTVSSINGNSELAMAFGRGMYTLLVGETDGAYTNTASVYMNAGETVNIAVLDTADLEEVPAVLNLAFAAGEEVVEKNPADYFDTDENGYYIIGSLESPVDIFVGDNDICYTYTAESAGTVTVTATVDGYTATNCWTKVNDGSFSGETAVAVEAGDVVVINIWSGFEGTVSLGSGDDSGDDSGDVEDTNVLVLGDNEVTLPYASMPMMATIWTYTATEGGYLTVTVASIDGNSNLGMAFGMGTYTLMVGETDGAWTNTATVYVNAGETVNITVLNNNAEAPAVLNLAFAAGEEVVEKNPADYFDTDENGYYVIGSLESPVDIFVGDNDICYTYTAESAGTVTVTATVDGYTATNCWTKVNDGSFTSETSVAVEAGDVVIINIWSGFEGTVSFEATAEEEEIIFDFVNYRVVFSDTNEDHKNFRAIVYKLGDQTVADPSDEAALKAIDPSAVTYWQAAYINKILITDAGNYVVLLKYNVGTDVVSVPMVLTVSADPKLIIDQNNKMTILDEDETHINHRVVVYYLAGESVEDIYDTEALAAIDTEPETHWQKTRINRLALTEGGTYVLHYQYNIGTSAAYTVAQSFTVESIPSLVVDVNNMFTATDDSGNTNHRVTIYNMGDAEVEDIFDETEVAAAAVSSETIWGLTEINKIEIKEAGNYIVHLYYNVATGHKRTLALDATLYERPVFEVTEDNKLNATYVDTEIISNLRATYYYFGENAIDGLDIYDAEALAAAATSVSETIWNQSAINNTVLTDRGNYVIHLDYNALVEGNSYKRTVATTTTVYDLTKPTIAVDENNMLVAANENVDAANIRATIYNLGAETVEDPADEAALQAIDSAAATKWGISAINKTQLDADSNYVIILKYNLGNAVRTVVLEVTR